MTDVDVIAAAIAFLLTIALWPFMANLIEVGRAVLAFGAAVAPG